MIYQVIKEPLGCTAHESSTYSNRWWWWSNIESDQRHCETRDPTNGQDFILTMDGSNLQEPY